MIGDNGAKNVGKGFSKCVALTSLIIELGRNNIGEYAGMHLGEGILKCVNLSFLRLNL